MAWSRQVSYPQAPQFSSSSGLNLPSEWRISSICWRDGSGVFSSAGEKDRSIGISDKKEVCCRQSCQSRFFSLLWTYLLTKVLLLYSESLVVKPGPIIQPSQARISSKLGLQCPSRNSFMASTNSERPSATMTLLTVKSSGIDAD